MQLLLALIKSSCTAISKSEAESRKAHVRAGQRFLIAHELGHWEYHRGQRLVCRVEGRQSALASERLADSYAADLLMPDYLFHPLALRESKLNFKAVGTLAETFKTSQTAVVATLAIRA